MLSLISSQPKPLKYIVVFPRVWSSLSLSYIIIYHGRLTTKSHNLYKDHDSPYYHVVLCIRYSYPTFRLDSKNTLMYKATVIFLS